MRRVATRIHGLSVERGQPLARAISGTLLALDVPNAVIRARQQLALRPSEALIQYQAHRALLWGGHIPEARGVLQRIAASSMPAHNILLAKLAQSCAEGGAGAKAIVNEMDKLPNVTLSGRWNSAMLAGDNSKAEELLKPLDEPNQLATLMQFLVYPYFDTRYYPLLESRLQAEGIGRRVPVRIPYACNPKTIG